jgi:hypothetical protein
LVVVDPDDGNVETWKAAGSGDKIRDAFANWEPMYVLLILNPALTGVANISGGSMIE